MIQFPGAHSAYDPAGPQAVLVHWLGDLLYAIATVVFVLVVAALLVSLSFAAGSRGRGRGDAARDRQDGDRRRNRRGGHGGDARRGAAAELRHRAPADRDDLRPKRSRSGSPGTSGGGRSSTPTTLAATVTRPTRSTSRSASRCGGSQADDVIHSFWVPDLAGKMDLIPGQHDRSGSRPTRPASTAASAPSSAACSTPRWRCWSWPSRAGVSTHGRERSGAGRGRRPTRRRGQRGVPRRHLRDVPHRPGHAAAGTLGPDLTHVAQPPDASPPARCRTRAGTWPDGSSIRSGSSPAPTCRRSADAAMTCDALIAYLESLQVSDRRHRASTARPTMRRRSEATGARRAPGRAARSSGLAQPTSTTSRSGSATSSPRSCSSLRRHRGGADADPAGAPGERAARARRLQPDLHDARHDDDVPVRGADADGGRAVPRPADGRHPEHRLPPPQRLRLLGLPHRRLPALRRPAAQLGARRGLVRLRAARRPGVLAGQADRHLRPDGDLHRDLRPDHAVEIIVTVFKHARAGHVAQPDAALRLGPARHRVHGDLRDAVVVVASTSSSRSTGWSTLASSTRGGAASRCSGSTSSGSSGTPRSTSSSCPRSASSPAIVQTFARRPIFGYPVMVLSLVATGFMAFGLWVHHMFATGIPQLGESFFTAAEHDDRDPDRQCRSSAGSPRSGLDGPASGSPLLFALGFVVMFIIGGFTGVMVASVPLDHQVHDTYFVVAHLHYVLLGGAVFPLFGAFYFWLPKMTGRMLSERLGPLALLAVLHRREPHLFPDAPAGPHGHAPAGLHLPAGDRLGPAQPARHDRRGHDRRERGGLPVNLVGACSRARPPATIPGRRRRSSGPPPRRRRSYNFHLIPMVQRRSPLWHRPTDAPVVSASGPTCGRSW